MQIEPAVALTTVWDDLVGMGAVWNDFYSLWVLGGLHGTLQNDPPDQDPAVSVVGAGNTMLQGC